MTEYDADDNSTDDEQHECPWEGCDRSFDTVGGMKTHHSVTHGESIAGEEIECKLCGEVFRSPPSNGRELCSRKCADKWRSESGVIAGENHPQWKGGEVNMVCEVCGVAFSTDPHRSDAARFCSQSCYGVWERKYEKIDLECEVCGDIYTVSEDREETSRFCSESCRWGWLSENNTGEDHHQYDRVKRQCGQCGKSVAIPRHREDTFRFCCDDCQSDWMAENAPSGQDHHQWRGGHTIYEAVKKLIRDESWKSETAPRIREHDDHECQVCGKHTSGQDRALTVNHLPALLDGGCNNDDVLFTVCDECHHKAEAYVRALPEVDLLLRDWTDSELPDGRGRWTPPEDPDPTMEQSTFGTFADD